MPKYIIKLHDDKTEEDYYMEWSTVVDAPVTRGTDKEDFMEYYLSRYGTSSREDLESRMERVEQKGTSAYDDSDVDETIKYNRAGVDESVLTKEQIIEKYCRI